VTLTFFYPIDFLKKQLELVFGVYPALYGLSRREGSILDVAKYLHSMNLISEEDTVLFHNSFRTALKHSSNLIEIHEIKDLINLKKS